MLGNFLRQGVLRGVAADVDQVDIPAPAYRPDTDARMEVSGADRTGQPAADGRCRCI